MNDKEYTTKISYIMVVLNGMPYIQAALKSIYKSAYQIIIIEGSVEKCAFAANKDGSSQDGTVEYIKSFSDPDNKIKLIQGSWPEKCEMQNRALMEVRGDYVWLVDSDEVYKEDDIEKIVLILENNPNVYRVDIPTLHFWKGYDYVIDTAEIPRMYTPRILKNIPPCYFTTHRPPTLFYHKLNATTVDLKHLDKSVLVEAGIYMYHYSYVTEPQVFQKLMLYRAYGWERPWKLNLNDWYLNCFLKWTPQNREAIEAKYRIHNCDKRSKTKFFTGVHPESMESIMEMGYEQRRANRTNRMRMMRRR
ncbi:MAG: glycosyltransferase family 2 protein [Candidatus Kariarchaeaceae archaeon]|jgi:glycosyltransferase involved in cell wall biosynthesis